MIFAAPWILLALVGLPLLWWLLRVTPPAPRREVFPAVRLLLGLKAVAETPARTPWWLLLLRMVAAALVIVGLAGPVLDAGDRLPGQRAGAARDRRRLGVGRRLAAADGDRRRRRQSRRARRPPGGTARHGAVRHGCGAARDRCHARDRAAPAPRRAAPEALAGRSPGGRGGAARLGPAGQRGLHRRRADRRRRLVRVRRRARGGRAGFGAARRHPRRAAHAAAGAGGGADHGARGAGAAPGVGHGRGARPVRRRPHPRPPAGHAAGGCRDRRGPAETAAGDPQPAGRADAGGPVLRRLGGAAGRALAAPAGWHSRRRRVHRRDAAARPGVLPAPGADALHGGARGRSGHAAGARPFRPRARRPRGGRRAGA